MTALDDVLSELENEDARAARTVKLRYYTGLGVREIASALELSERTIAREWAFARARLFELMGYGETEDSDLPG